MGPETPQLWKKSRARPGFEPGTSRTQSENHTPRPTSHGHLVPSPPPVLPQVTPVKLAAKLQLSVSSLANPRSQVRSCSPVSEGRLDYLLLVGWELEETPQLQLCSVLASNGGRRLRARNTSPARGLT